MKVISILNVSNVDDLECDSGVIFQSILASHLEAKGIEYIVIGPDIPSFHRYHINGARKAYVDIGGGRYYSRFNFDWAGMRAVIDAEDPDVIFNNQVEITSALRSLLVSVGKNEIKIVSYCHYPALSSIQKGVPILDESLNHSGLGISIVFNILSALQTSDAFLIQSDYAKSLIDAAAKYYNLGRLAEIKVIHPPADPILRNSNPVAPSVKQVLYNHRLYESYGTQKYLNFIKNNPRSDIKFVFSDPMPRRSSDRKYLSGSPAFYREEITSLPNTKLVDGNVLREEYKTIISQSRVAFAAMREACVWSMASIDCMGMGVPVIAPRYAAYSEFIPESLQYDNLHQAEAIMNRLLDNDEFWLKCSRACIDKSELYAPDIVAEQIYSVFNEIIKKS